jgi:hypothetical protein
MNVTKVSVNGIDFGSVEEFTNGIKKVTKTFKKNQNRIDTIDKINGYNESTKDKEAAKQEAKQKNNELQEQIKKTCYPLPLVFVQCLKSLEVVIKNCSQLNIVFTKNSCYLIVPSMSIQAVVSFPCNIDEEKHINLSINDSTKKLLSEFIRGVDSITAKNKDSFWIGLKQTQYSYELILVENSLFNNEVDFDNINVNEYQKQSLKIPTNPKAKAYYIQPDLDLLKSRFEGNQIQSSGCFQFDADAFAVIGKCLANANCGTSINTCMLDDTKMIAFPTSSVFENVDIKMFFVILIKYNKVESKEELNFETGEKKEIKKLSDSSIISNSSFLNDEDYGDFVRQIKNHNLLVQDDKETL